jgi:Xaa-Pro dipeptidase
VSRLAPAVGAGGGIGEAQTEGVMDQRSGLGSYAHGAFGVDYEARIDFAALREQRLERAHGALAASPLDALLLWKDENVRFLSGLRPQIIQGKSALLNGCLLAGDGSLVLFCSGGEVDRVRSVMPWVESVETVPIMEARGLIAGTVAEVIAPVLERHGLAAAAIGLDELAYAQVEELSRVLPEAELADGDAVMQSVRLIKSDAELAVMQEACAIGEAVTESAIAAVEPGVREYDVVAEAMHTLYRLGGEMAHLATPFVASGEHMSPPNRFASDKLIREGDLVFIDIGAMWCGYYSDIGRTVICGEPSARQREIFTAVRHALAAATDAMRPGNTNDDVAAAVRAEGERHGLGESFLSLFIGHGIGMGANEPPYRGEALPGAETVELRAGMTMAIEPLIWEPDVPGGGGVRLEDTIVVADGGGVALTRTGFDERLLDA